MISEPNFAIGKPIQSSSLAISAYVMPRCISILLHISLSIDSHGWRMMIITMTMMVMTMIAMKPLENERENAFSDIALYYYYCYILLFQQRVFAHIIFAYPFCYGMPTGNIIGYQFLMIFARNIHFHKIHIYNAD